MFLKDIILNKKTILKDRLLDERWMSKVLEAEKVLKFTRENSLEKFQ